MGSLHPLAGVLGFHEEVASAHIGGDHVKVWFILIISDVRSIDSTRHTLMSKRKL